MNNLVRSILVAGLCLLLAPSALLAQSLSIGQPFTPVVQAAAYSSGNAMGWLQSVSLLQPSKAGVFNGLMIASKGGATTALTFYIFDTNPTASTCTDKVAFVLNAADVAKLAMRPSERVRPPHVADSPVNFECKVHQVLSFGTEDHGGNLVLGEIVSVHLDESVLRANRDVAPSSRPKRIGTDLRAARNRKLAIEIQLHVAGGTIAPECVRGDSGLKEVAADYRNVGGVHANTPSCAGTKCRRLNEAARADCEITGNEANVTARPDVPRHGANPGSSVANQNVVRVDADVAASAGVKSVGIEPASGRQPEVIGGDAQIARIHATAAETGDG
jgi:hypothetical protein